MTEREFVDFATVRDKLLEAIERRGEISYEQTMALQHAEWKASASAVSYTHLTLPTICSV